MVGMRIQWPICQDHARFFAFQDILDLLYHLLRRKCRSIGQPEKDGLGMKNIARFPRFCLPDLARIRGGSSRDARATAGHVNNHQSFPCGGVPLRSGKPRERATRTLFRIVGVGADGNDRRKIDLS